MLYLGPDLIYLNVFVECFQSLAVVHDGGHILTSLDLVGITSGEVLVNDIPCIRGEQIIYM